MWRQNGWLSPTVRAEAESGCWCFLLVRCVFDWVLFQWCALCLCECGTKGEQTSREGPSRGGAALLERKLALAVGQSCSGGKGGEILIKHGRRKGKCKKPSPKTKTPKTFLEIGLKFSSGVMLHLHLKFLVLSDTCLLIIDSA